MGKFTTIEIEDAHEYMQTLNKNMVALANLLEGRLTPEEEELLTEVFEIQVDLQLLIDQLERQVYFPISSVRRENTQIANFVGRLANSLATKKALSRR